MLRRTVSILVSLALVCAPLPCLADPTPAPAATYAPPVITPINKGQPAPFSGVLLTPEAVAKVIADAQDCPKRTQVEVEHAVAVQKANDDKALADAQADAQRDKAVVQADADAKAAQIKTLTDSLQKSESARGNTWLYVGGGVVGGALLAIGTVVLVGLAK